MKIGHPADKPVPVAPTSAQTAAADAASKAAASGAAAVATPTSPDASATVELSSTASTLLLGGGSTPEFDAEKVSRISQAIANGTFKVDPKVIADKLISNAQELLSNAQH